MQLLRVFLVALVLQTVGAAQRQDKFLGNSTTEVRVLSFPVVWNRSTCKPLEKLVSIVSEYPSEVEHIFNPSCVPLSRCSGCCRDESLQCVPTEMANITMQLLKVSSEKSAPYVELSFVEHKECECRPRQEVLKSEGKGRPRESSKNKRTKQRLRLRTV
ncbi:placenta growth factor isoform X2 [Hemicordylus capensis]|nr:placenta growth factor isoform X2 [Hemicordylus capensis]